MKEHLRLWIGLSLLSGTLAATAAAPVKLTADQTEFFEKNVRPILADRCYKCHSAGEKIKGNLLVDTRDGLLKGGDSGPALVPGKPDKSLIIKAVRYDDADIAMPPKGDKLSDDQIEILEKWVRMGAPDPREAQVAAAPSGLKVDMAKAKEHWAFQVVKAPEVPKVKDHKHWVQTPLDSFVLAKLQEKGLEPSPKADKRTLIRRATYDLIGLPPTPEEVDAFIADKSPDAFAKVVDRLLASPRYGEQWGRHWLDVARYADSSGERLNGNRPNPLYPYAWTYRDYVIKSFNNDLPYDQFIIQQIAADRLPEAKEDKSLLAALGFLTVGKTFMNNPNDVIDDRIDVVTKGLMGLTAACARCHDHKFDPIPQKDYYSLHGIFASSIEPKEEPLLGEIKDNADYQDFLKQVAKVELEVKQYQKDEATRLTGGLLDRSGEYLKVTREESGQKVKAQNRRLIARKYNLDAITFEVWADTIKKISGQKNPIFEPWLRYAALSDEEFTNKCAAITASLKDGTFGTPVNAAVAKALTEKNPQTLSDVADVYTALLAEVQKVTGSEAYDYKKANNKRAKLPDTQATMPDADMDAIRQFFFAESSPIELEPRQMGKLLGVQFTTRESVIRGEIVQLELTHPGSPVRAMAMVDAPRAKDSRVMLRGEPGNLGVVAPRQFLEILAGDKREPFKDGSGRLELARSVASRDNPLTARVFVNRVWQEHFGEAIVRTPSDFGLRSEPPTHPEMLDYLAAWFMDNGWSVKKLHRLILLSSVYQQDSRANDKALAADPTNQWLWRMNIRRLGFEAIRDTFLSVGGHLDLEEGGRPVSILDAATAPAYNRRSAAGGLDLADGSYRRTVYGMVDRAALPEMYRTFDFANPDMSSGERYLTTVPQQALFMMNSGFVVQQMRNLLNRPEVQSASSDAAKVKELYRIAFQRAPSEKELQLSLDYLSKQTVDDAPAPASLDKVVMPQRPDKDALAKMTKDQRKAAIEAYRNALPAPKPRNVKMLTPWERYTQTILLANEFIFVN